MKEILPPNNMTEEELDILSKSEPVDWETLTKEEQESLEAAAEDIGAEIGESVLSPEELYDHGEELPESEE